MLVAETAAIDFDVKLPDGVRLDPVTDHAGVEAMMAVHDLAFTGHPSPELGERLVTQLRETPELVQMVVAMAGDEPVSAARVEFIPGTDFAGLWGGGTVPAWRGRGIFRALVAYRAGLAAARGYRSGGGRGATGTAGGVQREIRQGAGRAPPQPPVGAVLRPQACSGRILGYWA